MQQRLFHWLGYKTVVLCAARPIIIAGAGGETPEDEMEGIVVSANGELVLSCSLYILCYYVYFVFLHWYYHQRPLACHLALPKQKISHLPRQKMTSPCLIYMGT